MPVLPPLTFTPEQVLNPVAMARLVTLMTELVTVLQASGAVPPPAMASLTTAVAWFRAASTALAEATAATAAQHPELAQAWMLVAREQLVLGKACVDGAR